MINKLKNGTEKVVGKVKESAGDIMDDNELELKGKLQSMKADVVSKVDDLKEDALEKVNDLIDKIKEDKKK